MKTLHLEIDGMMCEGCVRRVEKLLVRAGVSGQPIVSIGSAQVTVDDSAVSAQAIVESLQVAGYRVREVA